MLKKLLVTGCTLFLLTACGTDTAKDNAATAEQTDTANKAAATNKDNNESTAAQESKDVNTPNTAAVTDITNPHVSLTEAVKIFQDAHPGAKVESVDLDRDDGRLHYDFEGFDSEREYETEIDATTGEIRENEVDNDRENDEFLDFSAIISPERAIEIASTQAEVKGLAPTDWSLEADDGKQKYTIDFDRNGPDDDIEIKINAVTEEILEVDID